MAVGSGAGRTAAAARPADAVPAGTDKADNGKQKKAGKAEQSDKPKAKTAKSKAKTAKQKDSAKAEPTTEAPARPATNANGVTQTAALTPGSESDDVHSSLGG
jgi:hypothetical protein